MADQEQLTLLKTGSQVWNHWRRVHPPELYTVNLHGADPHGANVSEANWSLAGWCDDDRRSATLHKADLRHASPCSANLWGDDSKTTNLEKVYWNANHEDCF